MGALARVPQSEPKPRLQGRLSLNRNKPASVIAPLPSEPDQYSEELNSVQRFELWLHDERNAFLIGQAIRGERNSPVEISKSEADRRLKAAVAALAALEGGGR